MRKLNDNRDHQISYLFCKIFKKSRLRERGHDGQTNNKTNSPMWSSSLAIKMSHQFAMTLPRNFNSSTANQSMGSCNQNNRLENFKLKLNNRLEALSQLSTASQAQNVETMSVSSRATNVNHNHYTGSLDRRNKYNTLTPGEAKKLNRTLINGRQLPTRTASVLHKPRAPPLVVDEFRLHKQYQDEQTNSSVHNDLRASSPVSVNTCGLPELPDPQEIYGTAYKTIRPMSIHGSTNTTNNNSNRCARSNSTTCDSRLRRNSSLRYATVKAHSRPNQQPLRYQQNGHDVPDRASLTKSVDLGHPLTDCLDIYGSTQTDFDLERSQLSNESFTSAASHFTNSTNDNSQQQKIEGSASKSSLSSSTSKVFQNQFSSLKRFFRNIPLRRSFISNSTTNTSNLDTQSVNLATEQQILSESISQLYLNRSQSPQPNCPPPPCELRSTTYMESYSNYDDFTKARNEKTNALLSSNRSSRLYLNGYHANNNHNSNESTQQQPVSPSTDEGQSPDSWHLASLPVSFERNLATVFEERSKLEFESKYDEVYRNQSKPGQDLLRISVGPAARQQPSPSAPIKTQDNNFEQDNYSNKQSATSSSTQSLSSSNATNDSVLDHQHRTSNQNNNKLDTDNSNNTHVTHLPPATPYRFSFAQPMKQQMENVSLRVTDPSSLMSKDRNDVRQQSRQRSSLRDPNLALRRRTQEIAHLDLTHKIYAFTSTISNSVSTNLDLLHESINSSSSLSSNNTSPQANSNDSQPIGLPPRMPLSMNTSSATGGSNGYDFKQQDTSSGASSSNSSVLGGQNDRESPRSLDKVTTSSEYGVITGITDTDADTTIMSDTSTLQGDYNTLAYMNRCSELERIVETLKERIVFKEKEITEFKLEQINSEYLIGQLKKTIGRLERENAQLRTQLMGQTNRVNL